MQTSPDRRSQLRLALAQLERAELYVVAARELAGAETEAGVTVERLREQLLTVADGLRQERRQTPIESRGLRAIGG